MDWKLIHRRLTLSRCWYSFTDPGRMENWVSFRRKEDHHKDSNLCRAGDRTRELLTEMKWSYQIYILCDIHKVQRLRCLYLPYFPLQMMSLVSGLHEQLFVANMNNTSSLTPHSSNTILMTSSLESSSLKFFVIIIPASSPPSLQSPSSDQNLYITNITSLSHHHHHHHHYITILTSPISHHYIITTIIMIIITIIIATIDRKSVV